MIFIETINAYGKKPLMINLSVIAAVHPDNIDPEKTFFDLQNGDGVLSAQEPYEVIKEKIKEALK